MKIRLLGMLICIAGTLFAQEDIRTETLLPFATHKDQWFVRKYTKLESGAPDYAAKIFIEKYNEGQERWPAIIAQVPKKMSDWRQVESVEFDAVSDNMNSYLAVRVYNGKASIAYGRQMIPTNPVTVKVPLLKNFNILKNVTALHLYQQDPVCDQNIWISDVRLNYRENFTGDFRSLEHRFNLCKENATPELLELHGKLAAAQKVTYEEYNDYEKKLNDIFYSSAEKTMLKEGNDSLTAKWTVPTEKILRSDNQSFPMANDLSLSAARGEAESAQLVIYTKKPLKNITVKLASKFADNSGHTLPENAVTITPVGYVNCPPPTSYFSRKPGWWPDPLLLYADKVDLEEKVFQPWWFEVTVPKGQPAGTYSATVEIVADGIAAVRTKATLKVRNFTLPDGSAYPLNISFDGVSSNVVGTAVAFPDEHPSHAKMAEWNKSVWDHMLTNRIGCDSLYHYKPVRAEDAKYKLDHGAKFFNICCLGRKPEQRFAAIDAAIEEYKKLGILDKAYFYGFDEASEATFKDISVEIKKVRDRYPGIPIFTTAYDHSFGNNTASPISDCIDWWCPLTPKYEDNLAQVAPARAKGRQVWWYICCGPVEPYANIFIEFPGLQARLILGAMYQKYKPDGFLYYAVTRWREGLIAAAPRRKIPMTGAPCTNWTGNSFCLYNGDGLLFYPGEKEILPSIRLKLLRDGMEDALYFQLLEKALATPKNMSEEWRKKAAKEVIIEPELVKSMRVYTDDISLLQAKMERVAKLLEEYHK